MTIRSSKQPWELTARQLNAAVGESLESKRQSGIEPWMITRQQAIEYIHLRYKKDRANRRCTPPRWNPQTVADFHEAVIRQAVEAGKPVPGAVLQDYPDLTGS